MTRPRVAARNGECRKIGEFGRLQRLAHSEKSAQSARDNGNADFAHANHGRCHVVAVVEPTT